jgi:hypothetical protein
MPLDRHPFQIIQIFLTGEAGPVTKRLLVSVSDQDGQAGDISLNPVLCPRLFGEKCFIHHRVPLDVGAHLHPVTMHDFSSALRLLHLRLFGLDSKTFVEVRLVAFNALFTDARAENDECRS